MEKEKEGEEKEIFKKCYLKLICIFSFSDQMEYFKMSFKKLFTSSKFIFLDKQLFLLSNEHFKIGKLKNIKLEI